MADKPELKSLGQDYQYGFHDSMENYTFQSGRGLTREIVQNISSMKKEPEWMLRFRLDALDTFLKKPMPDWADSEMLGQIDFDNIRYYMKPTDKQGRTWEEVPEGIKNTFDRLGIPEAERKFLAGVTAQYESEVVYHSLREDLQKLGVIFLGMDDGLRQCPDIVKKYFGTVIPSADNKFSALNSAVWSGGSFIYVPKGVSVPIPLQAYFRINSENMGQFERTLIIADEGSFVHYIEGCTAPTYSSDSLHSAVVELIALPGAKIRYTTIQNWSKNVFNLVTKRAVAHKNATVEWIDGNLGCLAEGSTVTTPSGMKTIESVDVGEEVLSYDESLGQLVFRKVTAKRQTGNRPVHRVSAGARSLWVTENHPFYSFVHDPLAPKKLGRYRMAYVRADQVKKAIVPRSSVDYGRPHLLQRPSLETRFDAKNQYVNSFSSVRGRESRLSGIDQTTNDIMWLFGYWVGDGNIELKAGKTEGVLRSAKVGFSTPARDRARERLVETVSALLDAPSVERRDGNHIYWSDTELAEIFRLNGFEGNARSKRIPSWVWSLPESQRLSFVAGYLDADGTVTMGRRCFSLKSVNRPLLQDVASLLLTLGIPSSLYTEFDTPRTVTIMGVECTAHGSHRLEFPLDARFFPCVSAQLRSRALSVPTAKLRHKRRVGRSDIVLPETVEIIDVVVSPPTPDPVPVWDIEVEGTGNFVSQGFIVHNSKLTMKYPAIYLMGEGARGEVLSVAFSGKDQHQDAGSKVVHVAPNTTSVVTSKSISKDGGRSSYRGLVKVARGATGCKSNVRCDALILDPSSRSDTYPTMEIDEEDVSMGHEATVSKIGEEQLFYLQSRGISEEEATLMIVNGFFEPFTKELPMEYAVELNRLLELEMEGSVG